MELKIYSRLLGWYDHSMASRRAPAAYATYITSWPKHARFHCPSRGLPSEAIFAETDKRV